MIQSEKEMYGYVDHLTGSSFSVPEDPQRDMIGSQFWSIDGIETLSRLPEVQMKAIYERSQANASVHASIRVPPLMTEPLTNIFEVENYSSLTETAGFPYSEHYVSSKNERLDTPKLLNHWTPEEETISNVTCMNTEWQQSEHSFSCPPGAVSNNNAKNIQSEFHGKMAVPSSPSTPSTRLSKKPRQRSKEANRKFVIAERLRALQELLPATLKVSQQSVQANQESVVDNAMGYIKHLELQLKDISASRLGGESISAPLFYVEGYGHYYPHGKKLGEPLEEVFGELIEEDPKVASKLLESKGLHMVPIDSIDALCRAESSLQ